MGLTRVNGVNSLSLPISCYFPSGLTLGERNGACLPRIPRCSQMLFGQSWREAEASSKYPRPLPLFRRFGLPCSECSCSVPIVFVISTMMLVFSEGSWMVHALTSFMNLCVKKRTVVLEVTLRIKYCPTNCTRTFISREL